MKKGTIGASILYIITRPLAILPLSAHRCLGRFFGWICGSVIRYRRDIVMTNLSRSFPEMKYRELAQTCKRFYAHFGKLVAETIWYGACQSPQGKDGIDYRGNKRLRRSRIVSIANVELINELHAQGKSIIMLASHCGNWELYGGQKAYTPADKGYAFDENDVCIVYRKLSSPSWDKFIARNRTAPLVDKANYDGMVESNSVIRYILSHRDRPRIYQFNMDQHPYKGSARCNIGKFMNQETSSMVGAPGIAKKLGMAVVYIHMAENPDGNYTIEFHSITEDASNLSIEQILARYYSLLESKLREQPWNYLWTHKRWR